MLYRTLFLFLLGMFLFATQAFAGGFSEDWSYSFHLQEVDGKVTPAKDSNDTYTPVPELFVKIGEPNETDFYGIIKNIKGKETARFGFNAPETTVALLGKSLFDVKAPFYADSDHVEFYTQSGKHLFDISVKGSSFCDDDAACDGEVGETYLNCPADCPPPPPVTTTPISTTTSPTSPTVQPSVETPEIPVAVSNPTTTTTETSSDFPSKTTITLSVLGLVFLVLIFILWKLRGFRDE
jgi:hypothetical protein